MTTTLSADTATPAELAGRTFRMMREAHGLPLREVAAAVGCSASTLSRIELGRREAGDWDGALIDFYGQALVGRPQGEKCASPCCDRPFAHFGEHKPASEQTIDDWYRDKNEAAVQRGRAVRGFPLWTGPSWGQ